ncbi:MAG: hypothetical protein OXM58_19090 [Rhodospirillaceae bacterium]|nr:hypothetical protein [Rhodospirillaceae bacterium]MDE0618462.1 hypothetical protein [Rhodospirillaceae bacterium]
MKLAAFRRLRDGAQDGVTVIVAKIDANGIAGIHEPVNGGGAMHRRGGATLHHGHGDGLAMSPFHDNPVLTPAEFLERVTGR